MNNFDLNTKWITFDKACESVCVYKKCLISRKNDYYVNVCGLGFYEFYINGEKVSDDVLTPAWSDYRERDFSTLLYPSNDVLSHRVYFNRYDVSKFFREGENLICVMIGNGWYRQTKRIIEGRNHYGEELLLRFELRNEEDEIVLKSDEEWEYCQSFIKETNIFYGEKHDYSLPAPESGKLPLNLKKCLISHINLPIPELQRCPLDRKIREIPVRLVSVKNGKKIYKASETVSGYPIIKSFGGDVSVRFADGIKEDGELDFTFTGGEDQIQQDDFLNTEYGTILYPRFTWHAFTYFELTGNAEVESVQVVHANVKQNVFFESSSENLNWLFNAYVRTQLDNMHCGVPSDCPHRERLGYTGDGQITARTSMLIFDSKEFYKKWIRDILDCQDKKSGHVQHTAPFYGGGGGPGGWGGAIAIVPYEYYKRFNDKEMLIEAFPHIEKWVESMLVFSENGLIVREYKDGWCLGEWCTPDPVALPEPFVNTYYFIKALGRIIEICEVLEKESDKYLKIKKTFEEAFVRKYFDEETGDFVCGVQGANAFGLSINCGDERTAKRLVEKYRQLGHFDTGIFGTEILGEVLCSLGVYDLLFDLLNAEDFPSFGFMRKSGSTTLWEDWDGRNSRNHPMFGGIVKTLIEGFAGISYSDGKFKITPHLPKGLDYIKIKEDSDRGKFSVEITKEGTKIY